MNGNDPRTIRNADLIQGLSRPPERAASARMKNFVVSLAVIAAAGMSASAASFIDHASYLAATVNNVVINFDTDPAGNPLNHGQEIGSTYAAWGAKILARNHVGAAAGHISSPFGWFNDTFNENWGHIRSMSRSPLRISRRSGS